MAVVVDGFEKLAGRPDGTLTMMREIAKIAARKGSTTTRISTDGRFPLLGRISVSQVRGYGGRG
jgi:hypothetical protein